LINSRTQYHVPDLIVSHHFTTNSADIITGYWSTAKKSDLSTQNSYHSGVIFADWQIAKELRQCRTTNHNPFTHVKKRSIAGSLFQSALIGTPMTELRDVTGHISIIWDHSVTCYQAQVNAPRPITPARRRVFDGRLED